MSFKKRLSTLFLKKVKNLFRSLCFYPLNLAYLLTKTHYTPHSYLC